MKTRFSRLPIAGLIGAEFLSLLGNQVAAIAIPLLVLQQTHSIIITGIAVLANNLPFVVAALVGGKAIDLFGAWKVSVTADLLSFLSVMCLPLVFIFCSGNVTALPMITLIFLGAVFDPTGMAARNTLVPVLSRFAGRRISHINSIRGSLENAADFMGPVIGIGLISFAGIRNTIFVNALSFLCCAFMFALTVPYKRTRVKLNFNRNIWAGVRFIFHNKLLGKLAVTGMIAGFVISSFLGLLLLVLTTQVFHNTSLFGISLSAFSLSAVISSLLFSTFNRLYSYTFIYYAGLLMIGAGIFICGMVTTKYGVVFSAALAGAAGAGNPLEQTILQQETSKENAGQVFTALPAIRFMAGTLGLLVTGILTETWNVHLILCIEGGLLIITAVCGWLIAPLKKGNGKDACEIRETV